MALLGLPFAKIGKVAENKSQFLLTGRSGVTTTGWSGPSPISPLHVVAAVRPDLLTASANSREIVRIDRDGRIFWNGREVVTDEQFRGAMLDLANALKKG